MSFALCTRSSAGGLYRRPKGAGPGVQSTRESRADRITHEQAVRLIESLLVFPVADITPGTMLAAIATRKRFKVSYWDVAIIEAARSLGCEVVLSEDLGDDQDYSGVRVENPFRAADTT
jgi:predicted nucleic acid-binding protein